MNLFGVLRTGRPQRGAVAPARLRGLLTAPAGAEGAAPAAVPEAAAAPDARAPEAVGGASPDEAPSEVTPPDEVPPAAWWRSAPARPDEPAAPAARGAEGREAPGTGSGAPEPAAVGAAAGRPGTCGEPADGRPPRRPGDLGRFDPGVPGARALAIAGLVAALVAAGYLWRSRPDPQPVPAPGVVSPAAAPGAASPGAAARTGPSGGMATVHVAGKVRRPGVVSVPAGARVADAVEAAGGAKPGADTSTVNLARRVVDGEQILVGVPGGPGAPGTAAGAPAGAPGAAGAAGGGQLDLNTATLGQLEQLPGVGPVLAQRMLDFRTQQGGYQSVDQLRQVTGIGDRRFAELKDRVRV